MQGTRRLVAPVGWQPGGSGGIPEQVSGEGQPAAEAAAIGAPAATAVTGNSNTTGLAALQGQSPALNGSGTLICVVDTGECVSVCVCECVCVCVCVTGMAVQRGQWCDSSSSSCSSGKGSSPGTDGPDDAPVEWRERLRLTWRTYGAAAYRILLPAAVAGLVVTD